MYGSITLRERFIALVVGLVCVIALIPYFSWIGGTVSAMSTKPRPNYTIDNAPPEGDADYPVQLNKSFAYWAINCPISKETTEAVDHILEDLNAAHIAQGAILCMRKEQVPNQPVAYAERFVRYMGLGMKDGDRKNNGFTWLIRYDDTSVDVWYGVGDGLPALTALDLQPLKTSTAALYKSKGIEGMVMVLAEGFDAAARTKYQPLLPVDSPVYGDGSTKKEDADPRMILFCLMIFLLFLGAVLISEPVLAFFVVIFASESAYAGMAWPLKLLGGIAQAIAESDTGGRSGGGYSGSRSTGGGSGGGGGHSGGGGGSSNRGG